MVRITITKTSVYKECPNEEKHREERLKKHEDIDKEEWVMSYYDSVRRDNEPNYCTECGELLINKSGEYEATVCSDCYEPVMEDDNYCHSCGQAC